MEPIVCNPKNKCHKTVKKNLVINEEIADLLLCQLLFSTIFCTYKET